MIDKKKEFADYLKEMKNKLGLNHNQFAELIGHSRDTYLKWYNEVYYPDDIKRAEIIKIIDEAVKKLS